MGFKWQIFWVRKIINYLYFIFHFFTFFHMLFSLLNSSTRRQSIFSPQIITLTQIQNPQFNIHAIFFNAPTISIIIEVSWSFVLEINCLSFLLMLVCNWIENCDIKLYYDSINNLIVVWMLRIDDWFWGFFV